MPVTALGDSVDFYQLLFGVNPDKTRDDYARFSVAEPPLNLSLMPAPGAGDFKGHFGVQVKSSDEVNRMIERMRDSGLAVSSEDQQACCYAVQDKLWVSDPDGNRWEVFVNTDDHAPRDQPEGEPCCVGEQCC